MNNKIKKKVLVVLLFAIIYALPAFAQQINTAKLDSLFDAISMHDKGMGSVAVAKNGQLVYSRAIGYSKVTGDDKTPATAQTKYKIASITKMFTAAMVFQLIEEGKIGLGTTLDTYFPQMPGAKVITISDLLNHRSGLHNFINDTSWRTGAKTEAEMLEMIANTRPEFEPGSKTSYSNTNFVLLGYIIERICKKSYSEVLQERIIAKLGLNDTYYGNKPGPAGNESLSYQFNGGRWGPMKVTDMSLLAGAGAIVSTPADLTVFADALFAGRLISHSSLEKMKTITDGRGMGLVEIPFVYKKGYGHTGNIDGFFSVLVYYPSDSLTVAYCSNGAVIPINDILVSVLSICFKESYQVPTYQPVSINTQELDKYLGVYLSPATSLKITFTKDNRTLIAQATNQSAFSLKAIGNDSFASDFTGIEMVFDTEKNEMILKQYGRNFFFKKI